MNIENSWAFSALKEIRKVFLSYSAKGTGIMKQKSNLWPCICFLATEYWNNNNAAASAAAAYLFWIILGDFRHFDLIQPIFLPPEVVHPEPPGPQLVTRAYYLGNKSNRWLMHQQLNCTCSSESSTSVMTDYKPPVCLISQYGYQSKCYLKLIEGKGIGGKNPQTTTCPSPTRSTSETELENGCGDYFMEKGRDPRVLGSTKIQIINQSSQTELNEGLSDFCSRFHPIHHRYKSREK